MFEQTHWLAEQITDDPNFGLYHRLVLEEDEGITTSPDELETPGVECVRIEIVRLVTEDNDEDGVAIIFENGRRIECSFEGTRAPLISGVKPQQWLFSKKHHGRNIRMQQS